MGKKKPVAHEEVEEESEGNTPQLTAEQTQNLMRMLQDPVARAEEFVNKLDAPVRNRVRALQGMQTKLDKLRVEYQKDLHELMKKYEKIQEPIFTRRSKIINGLEEATAEETAAGKELIEKEYQEDAKELDKDDIELLEKTFPPNTEAANTVTGIPEFWLRVLQQNPHTADMIQERDEDALKSLTDIRTHILEEPRGFVIEFEFAENAYFTDKVLTKKYLTIEELSEELLDKAEGCTINWNADKNLTVIKKTKKQRHKNGKAVRTVTQTEPCDSFFNFFQPPQLPEDKDEEDEEAEHAIGTDYEIGKEIRDEIIERAFDWYTGKAAAEVDDGPMDYEGDEEEEDEDEDEEDEPPKKKGAAKQVEAKKGGDDKKGGEKAGEKQECKNQ